MASDNGRPSILSEKTLVPLGLVLLIGGPGFLSYRSIMDAIGVQRDDIRDVKEDVRSLRAEVNNRTNDRWTKTDMKVWALQLQQALQVATPSVRIPTPD